MVHVKMQFSILGSQSAKARKVKRDTDVGPDLGSANALFQRQAAHWRTEDPVGTAVHNSQSSFGRLGKQMKRRLEIYSLSGKGLGCFKNENKR